MQSAPNRLGISKGNNGITIGGMELISVKLPPALRAKVEAEAQRRNVSQSIIVRESLERVLTDPTSRGEASCVDLAGNLVGSLRSGRRDLWTNKKLLADAMVSNARRAASVIVDTGPIVALLDADDRQHAWVKAQFARLRLPLLTCEAVLTESSFLIADVISLLQHAGLLSLTDFFLCNKRRLKGYCAIGIVGL
jgi:hypothetical protein